MSSHLSLFGEKRTSAADPRTIRANLEPCLKGFSNSLNLMVGNRIILLLGTIVAIAWIALAVVLWRYPIW
jgi:hypothetical protein